MPFSVASAQTFLLSPSFRLDALNLDNQVRGIGGKDIAEGTAPKLTMAILWQLMRAHACQLLAQLGVGEGDIIDWANARVRSESDSTPAIKGFSDPSLRSGTFILRLLHNRTGVRRPRRDAIRANQARTQAQRHLRYFLCAQGLIS